VRDGDGDPTDAVLLARARHGEPEALDRLLSRHREVAYRVALGVVHEPEDAADAVQDAFLKAFRGLEGFRAEARFRTWLLSIVVNEARALLRRRSRRSEMALEDAPEAVARGLDPAARVVLEAESARARRALAGLPEKQRLSVQLRVDEGLSFRELAEVIGSTEGAARVNYHHGIRRLREMLEGDR
jgi:RNA polymerase sigma-70 factor, ECF subfamily